MLQQTTVVTTTCGRYTLDCIEQFCYEPSHPLVIQQYLDGAMVDQVIEGKLVSVVVVTGDSEE